MIELIENFEIVQKLNEVQTKIIEDNPGKYNRGTMTPIFVEKQDNKYVLMSISTNYGPNDSDKYKIIVIVDVDSIQAEKAYYEVYEEDKHGK